MSTVSRNLESLPQEVIRPIKRTSFFFLLITTILVLCGWNSTGALYLRLNPGNRTWIIIDQVKKPYDVLIFGDSTAFSGLDSEHLEKNLHATVFNLASSSVMTPIMDAWSLQEYLRRYKKPRLIIMSRFFYYWAASPKKSAFISVPFGFRKWFQFRPAISLNLDEKMQFVLSQLFPLYRADQTLKAAISNPVELYLSLKQTRSQVEERTFGRQGFSGLTTYQDDRFSNVANFFINIMLKGGPHFNPSQAAKDGMEEIIRIAEKNGIFVVIVNSPVYEGFASKEFTQLISEEDRFLSTYQEKHKNVFYIKRTFLYPKSWFADGWHLNYRGAQSFTEDIAQEIKQIKALQFDFPP